jgi:hypothetical protein
LVIFGGQIAKRWVKKRTSFSAIDLKAQANKNCLLGVFEQERNMKREGYKGVRLEICDFLVLIGDLWCEQRIFWVWGNFEGWKCGFF